MLTPPSTLSAQKSPAESIRNLQQLAEQLSVTVERLAYDMNDFLSSRGRDGVQLSTNEKPPADNGVIDWQKILLDLESSKNPCLDEEGAELTAGLVRNDAAAMGLVGRLLVFRAAPKDQLPPMLKEIGEAFYRWRDRLDHEPVALREAMVDRLTENCAKVGLGHRIELVQVGDRLDRNRHQAIVGGVELKEVRGWIVLRDNGSIYTKAFVETK